jgi:hypothetical protein
MHVQDYLSTYIHIFTNRAQELKTYIFEFNSVANRIINILSTMRLEPGSLGRMADTLANSTTPKSLFLHTLGFDFSVILN